MSFPGSAHHSLSELIQGLPTLPSFPGQLSATLMCLMGSVDSLTGGPEPVQGEDGERRVWSGLVEKCQREAGACSFWLRVDQRLSCVGAVFTTWIFAILSLQSLLVSRMEDTTTF